MRLAAALVLLAAPAAADILPDLGGLYTWDTGEPAAACSASDYNDARLEIEGNSLLFGETTCKLGDPVTLRDMPEGMLYDATCVGEGDVWTERVMVYRTYAGVAVISRGAVRTYRACE